MVDLHNAGINYKKNYIGFLINSYNYDIQLKL